MVILIRGNNEEKHFWFDEAVISAAARDFHRRLGFEHADWETKSPDRAAQIASQLGQFGFKVLRNKDDECVGLLPLSQAAAMHQQASAAASRP